MKSTQRHLRQVIWLELKVKQCWALCSVASGVASFQCLGIITDHAERRRQSCSLFIDAKLQAAAHNTKRNKRRAAEGLFPPLTRTPPSPRPPPAATHLSESRSGFTGLLRGPGRRALLPCGQTPNPNASLLLPSVPSPACLCAAESQADWVSLSVWPPDSQLHLSLHLSLHQLTHKNQKAPNFTNQQKTMSSLLAPRLNCEILFH